jgi:hypothetical protein
LLLADRWETALVAACYAHSKLRIILYEMVKKMGTDMNLGLYL